MNLTSYKKFYFHCLVSVELKPHTKVSKNLFHNMALKNLYVTTMLPSKTRLKQYYNNAINVRISLDGYVSEIQKVSRCRPKVSNETIPATKLEFFFKKVTPVTDTVILGFWLIILPWMFISSYTTIYFFIKIFFFKCLYFSEFDIQMFLFAFWLRNRPSIKYVCNWGNGRGSSKTYICHKIRMY